MQVPNENVGLMHLHHKRHIHAIQQMLASAIWVALCLIRVVFLSLASNQTNTTRLPYKARGWRCAFSKTKQPAHRNHFSATATAASDMHFVISYTPHTRKIVLHCLLVTTPMLASALVILGIVYSKLVTSNCPDVELCRGSDFANSTSNHVYYVDYPAARLAFISSWSSTVSFALVSFLMAFSAYINAAELLGASESGEQDSLPTPHQMSVLLRVLNAELMVLWDLAALRVKSVFWRAEKDSSDPTTLHQTSPILSTSITILLGGIVAR
jgi:hypothetical protein